MPAASIEIAIGMKTTSLNAVPQRTRSVSTAKISPSAVDDGRRHHHPDRRCSCSAVRMPSSVKIAGSCPARRSRRRTGRRSCGRPSTRSGRPPARRAAPARAAGTAPPTVLPGAGHALARLAAEGSGGCRAPPPLARGRHVVAVSSRTPWPRPPPASPGCPRRPSGSSGSPGGPSTRPCPGVPPKAAGAWSDMSKRKSSPAAISALAISRCTVVRVRGDGPRSCSAR